MNAIPTLFLIFAVAVIVVAVVVLVFTRRPRLTTTIAAAAQHRGWQAHPNPSPDVVYQFSGLTLEGHPWQVQARRGVGGRPTPRPTGNPNGPLLLKGTPRHPTTAQSTLDDCYDFHGAQPAQARRLLSGGVTALLRDWIAAEPNPGHQPHFSVDTGGVIVTLDYLVTHVDELDRLVALGEALAANHHP